MSDMAHTRMTRDQLQAVVTANPFNDWLQLSVVRLTEREIELHVPGRPEFIGTAALQRLHGGVISSLVDVGCGYAVLAATGHGVSTINLHTDFHRAANLGELRVTGRVLHEGGTICSAEAFIHDSEGSLLASGRGTFYKARHSHPAIPGVDNNLETPHA